MKQIKYYETEDGDQPLTEWLDNLNDVRGQAKIEIRLERVEEGNLGDVGRVGKGVHELRIHFGPGYRVYFGNIDKNTILLLSAGIKKNQKKDIKKATEFWTDYLKGRNKNG